MEMAITSSSISIPRASSQSLLPFSISSSQSSFFSVNSELTRWKKASCRLDLNTRATRRRGLCCKCLFGLGVPELVVIAGVAAVLFGPKQLPEVGRSFGKTIKSFQQAAKEFETELKKDPDPLKEIPTATSEEDTKQEPKVESVEKSL